MVTSTHIAPSIAQNYARSRGASDAPQLWPLAAWDLGGMSGKGATAFDLTERKNHGILTDMDPSTDYVLSGNPLRSGYALDFDGSNDYITISEKVPRPATRMAITVWSLRKDATQGYVISRGLLSGGTWSTFRVRFNTNGKLSFSIQDHILVQFPAWEIDTVIPVNTWSYSAFNLLRMTGAESDVEAYLNGVPISSTFSAGSYSSAFSSLKYSEEDFRLGSGHSSPIPYNPLNGQIGEVFLYGRPLLTKEVALLYRVAAPFVVRPRSRGSTAPAAGGLSIPVAMANYRRLRVG